MGRKIIIFEGNDNSGKTTTIENIKNQFGNKLTYLHFPSDELVNSHLFSECIYAPSPDTILSFIDALINEIKAHILSLDKMDSIIIDRCFLSSLVYQGVDDTLYESIKFKYTKMFQDLGMRGEDVYHIILCGKLAQTDDKEENEIKKQIDADKSFNDIWVDKLQNWYALDSTDQYLKNIITFKVDLNNIDACRECIYYLIDFLCGW